jgi:hypothetical protein
MKGIDTVNREELHELLNNLPDDKLKVFEIVLNETLNHIEVAWEEALEEENDWWKKPIEEAEAE